MEENKDLELEQTQVEENIPVDVEVDKQEQEGTNEPETEAVQENTEAPAPDEAPQTEEGVVEEVEQEPKEEEDGEADAEEEQVEIPKEEETPEEEPPKEEELSEKISTEQAELVSQLEELRAEKEDREALEACNKEVMKVEQEFQQCTNRIAEALRVSFAQNDIDPSKSIEELRKENPAKATLAEQFITQAVKLKEQLEKAATQEITKQQNDVIYRTAAREFAKLGLNFDQAKDAVVTFKRIVDEIGVADLGDDLKLKVQLAAGRAMITTPNKEVSLDTPVPLDTTELKEASPEIEKVEELEKVEEEKEVPPPEEKEPEAVVQKPSVEDFEEGVTGSTSTASGSVISEFNVLEELVKLPYKEQRAFYKQHEDLISKALIKGQK